MGSLNFTCLAKTTKSGGGQKNAKVDHYLVLRFMNRALYT